MLPSRAPPSRTVPNVPLPDTPLGPRQGRVILDTTDGPMRVAARYDPSFVPPGGPIAKTRSGELCTTPCVTDLPVGRYRLYLSSVGAGDAAHGDADELLVTEGVQAYRRAPGQYSTPTPTAQVAPGIAIVLSSVAVVGGLVMLGESKGAPLGIVLTAGGLAGGIASGIWAYDSSRATQQDGATTTWVLSR